MKSSILGLRTTIYKVSDMEKARKWYATAFQVEAYFDEPFYIGFNVQGYELGLQPEEKAVGKKVESVLTYWGVTDIHQEFKRLLELGATTHEEPTNVGGELMVASLIDPWGNLIGLIYNPSFKLPD